jgi:arylsulfatase A
MKLRTIALCFACVVSLGGALRAEEARKPNVIYILSDDLGYGDVGCYGQTRIKTPSIDRIAAEGMRFTQSYAGCTVCAPSRCALLTGLHTGHCYIRGNKEVKPEGQEPLPAGTFTVARLFQQNGYYTGIIGKWGLGYPGSSGTPDKMGFDYFFGYNCQRLAHNYYPDHLWRNNDRVELDGKTYSHDLLAEDSLKFIKDHHEKPFFLYLAFTIPHAELQVPDDGPYADESWPASEKHYAAMVTRMDRDIGRLLDLLKQESIDDNTLVIFASDNGPHHEGGQNPEFFDSNGPLRGVKRDMYEGGIREPVLARWPGKIKPGTVSDEQWAFWDFLPTVADLLGVQAPSGLDGISILPTFLGQPQKSHALLYWEFHEKRFDQAVRMGDWKGVRKGVGGSIELYDLKADIGEKHDVAADHSDVVEKIAKIMETEHTESPIWPASGKGAPSNSR